MPSYKLTYFNIKGARGDSIRMAFHYGGIPFTDERLTPEEFGKIQEKLPFGQVPILTVDEKKVISQEVAILRYIGRLVGLYPDDREEAVNVDIPLSFVDDLYSAVLVFFTPEQPGKEFATNMVIEDRIPKLLACLDNYLANKGTTFSAGNNLTVADLRIYSALTLYKSGKFQGLAVDLVNNYPKIANLYREIEGHEKLVNWKKAQA
ncbi:hypothetical protein PGT21_036495 [Puccinia graminis f. sp. tritici]|uniref:Glutathione S-transferase n=2 Tax=Puccinia graminis f. sp. tritici TaxID=56615 RepID=E3KMV1_PUCGT|nr:uncharacterized protein PGTG_11129 [Puccinia graminis f. sp. tritici CRL 75-36-700-3]EFP85800.1 hypothetical protein PGTG_11129 [Puccinia graminis f. sp. tritici CRL 75-36-700-3]KAA1087816.1 hypothetical protein PGTUg99_050156 [Puccinia graminis f. sp. tritici]KAA1098594.1 hypothetical protein PGT21_036749 [Puccinia graminis f. sp. tritici]KAA1102163.1 hypothetical protein PGT21_036495 [Puccinia graminis f. sp. tritici]